MRHFVPFLLVLLVIAFVLRIDLFFTVVYFLAGVYILSRLWVRHCLQRVIFTRRFVNRAFPGDVLDVTVHIRNTGRLPVPWLQMRESIPTQLMALPVPGRVLTLGPREEQSFSYQLACRKRGYFTLGPFFLTIGDLLGAEHQLLTKDVRDVLLVYPRVVPIDRLKLQALAVQSALPTPSPLIEDPTRLLGVRDYQRGDSPRRIHWPASGRLAHLVVKQYQPAIARDTTVFLDLDTAGYDAWDRDAAIELAIVAAASLANHIIVRDHLPVGLVTEGSDALADRAVRRFSLPPRADRAQLLAILEVLARVNPVQHGRFAAELRRAGVFLAWGASVVAITGVPGDELLESLLYLRRGGFAVSLILVEPPRGLNGRGSLIPTHIIQTERDLEVVS